MKQWKKFLISKGDDPQEVDEEDEYRISDGCCYFHDQEELNEFNDIDDDNPKNA
ncbi:MAG: hypothetical protein ACFE9C_11175 [Candidatus Hodarchaeota archaeon]